MPVLLDEKKPEGPPVLGEDDLALLVGGEEVPEQGGGGDGDGGFLYRGGDRPTPHREWPRVPAIVAVVIVGALLTFLGMLTQIWANLAGAQLPGS